MKLFAVVKTLSAGYDSDKLAMNNNFFKIGDVFEVSRIEMGRSSTKVYLHGYDCDFNSVFFKFETNDGTGINIFKEKHPLVVDMYSPFIFKNSEESDKELLEFEVKKNDIDLVNLTTGKLFTIKMYD